MLAVAVDTAGGKKAEEVQGTAAGKSLVNDIIESGVLIEAAVFDSAGDAGKLLIDDAAGTDISVAYFTVAHLSVGEADSFAGGGDGSGGTGGGEAVKIGGVGTGYSVVLTAGADAPAVHDDEADGGVLYSCH